MKSNESTLSAAALAYKVAQGETSFHIADVVLHAWRQINVALSPLIGHRGVAGLYQRTLHVTGNDYPWLAICYKGITHEMNLEDLQKILAQQSSSDAANAGGMLFQTFHDLLGSLIGPALTELLLQSIWISSSSGTSAQDSTP